jgi:hypothetical protein
MLRIAEQIRSESGHATQRVAEQLASPTGHANQRFAEQPKVGHAMPIITEEILNEFGNLNQS